MSNIADSPGVYTNFSGRISYRWSDCEVKNATFELLENKKLFKRRKEIWIEFQKGNIISGDLWGAKVKHCNFNGRGLVGSVFRDGIFNGDTIRASYWYGGTWISGDWGEDNFDKFGRLRFYPPPFDKFDKVDGVVVRDGRYLNFTGHVKFGKSNFYIKNGEFETEIEGDFHKIAIYDGKITKGDLYCAIIDCVEFNGDSIVNCVWHNGIFDGGEFVGGQWYNGVWNGGKWKGRNWYGGYDKDGVYHEKYDSPNDW